MDDLTHLIQDIARDAVRSDLYVLRDRVVAVEQRLAALEAKVEPKPKPEPTTGGLVEAVTEAWNMSHEFLNANQMAHVAIEAVAKWLGSRDLHGTASVLRRELDSKVTP